MAGPIGDRSKANMFDTGGTVPNMSGALTDYFQAMVFNMLTKTSVAGQAVETEHPINFQGVIQPLDQEDLLLRPEGQRSWTWYTLHSDLALNLKTDDIVLWQGKPTRVMFKKDFVTYGYREYGLVQDWEQTP